MGALIRGWRQAWGQGDFPWLYVQKPSGGGCAWDPQDPIHAGALAFSPLPAAPVSPTNRPDLIAGGNLQREQLLRVRANTNTFMVPTRDLVSEVHPFNKWGYAQRAVRVALGAVYGRNLVISGPTYRSHKIEGDSIRVLFDNVGSGLAFRHGERLQGFAIAGDDHIWHWAEAVIEPAKTRDGVSDTVVVRSAAVKTPQAVRYAYDPNTPRPGNWWMKVVTDTSWANLFNKDGLPADMFRTEDWSVEDKPW
jgi:sialate O-acetylesterase